MNVNGRNLVGVLDHSVGRIQHAKNIQQSIKSQGEIVTDGVRDSALPACSRVVAAAKRRAGSLLNRKA